MIVCSAWLAVLERGEQIGPKNGPLVLLITLYIYYGDTHGLWGVTTQTTAAVSDIATDLLNLMAFSWSKDSISLYLFGSFSPFDCKQRFETSRAAVWIKWRPDIVVCKVSETMRIFK